MLPTCVILVPSGKVSSPVVTIIVPETFVSTLSLKSLSCRPPPSSTTKLNGIALAIPLSPAPSCSPSKSTSARPISVFSGKSCILSKVIPRSLTFIKPVFNIVLIVVLLCASASCV